MAEKVLGVICTFGRVRMKGGRGSLGVQGPGTVRQGLRRFGADTSRGERVGHRPGGDEEQETPGDAQ